MLYSLQCTKTISLGQARVRGGGGERASTAVNYEHK